MAILLVVVGGALFRLATGSSSRATASWTVGGDFAEFYIAGRILNAQQGERLYDLALQKEIFDELVPGETSLRVPFLYPPFVAVLFQPIARLSPTAGLTVFMIAAPLALLLGLRRLTSQFGPPDRLGQAVVLLGGLSFFPFIGYNWLGAQISVIGFLSMTWAITEEDRGHRFWSGVALSVCLYKPTLMILVVPMLILSGRFRQIAGLVTGAVCLALISLAVAGREGVSTFVQKMIWMGRPSTLDSGLFNPFRYVDLMSFLRLLPSGQSRPGWVAALLIVGAVTGVLISIWVDGRKTDRNGRLLMWAATLTWTLVLNVYVPFYDCVLILAPAVIAASVVHARQGSLAGTGLIAILSLVYFVPLIAESFARVLRVQLYTPVLAAFGAYLLASARRPLQAEKTPAGEPSRGRSN